MPSTQELLTEAEAALHQLRMGKARASIGFGDRQVTYTKANLADLKKYVAELKAKLVGRKPMRNRVRYGVPD